MKGIANSYSKLLYSKVYIKIYVHMKMYFFVESNSIFIYSFENFHICSIDIIELKFYVVSLNSLKFNKSNH